MFLAFDNRLVPTTLVFLLSLAVPAAAVTLVDKGQARATIVTPDAPSEAEALAAERLQYYLREISGATLKVVPEAEAPAGNKVFVGRTQAGTRVREELAVRQPPAEASLTVVAEDAVFIVGVDDPGTIHATYFLMEDLGCRWYFPAAWGTVIPRRKKVVLPNGTTYQAPHFAMRAGLMGYNLGRDEDPEWGAAEWGRGNHLGGWRWWGSGHSYQYLVQPLKYFEQHPEYFAEVNGQRQTSQLCVTNEDVRDIALQTVRRVLGRAVPVKLICVSPNDGHGFCHCTNCRKLISEGGGYADQIVDFANHVARGIRPADPDRLVTFYADYHSVGVPRSVRPEPNLCFWIVQWAQDQFHGVTDDTKMGRSLRDWSQFENPIIVYTYYGSYGSFSFWPQVHAIRRDIPYYKARGVVGLYSETHQHWATQHLNFIVFPRLLWNVETDVDALIDEFCRLFYGPAAPSMRAYYDLLETTAQNGPPQYHLNSDIVVTFSPTVLAQLATLIGQAQAAVAGTDDLYRKRLEFVAKGFQVAQLYVSANHLKRDYAQSRDPATRAEIIRRYRDLLALIQAPQHRNRLVENRIAEEPIRRELAALERGTTFPVGRFSYHDGYQRGGKSDLDAVKKSGFANGVWGLDMYQGGTAEIIYKFKADGGVLGQVKITSLNLRAFGSVQVDVGFASDGPFQIVAQADSPDRETMARLQPPVDLTEHVRGRESFFLRLTASNQWGTYINAIHAFGLQGEVVPSAKVEEAGEQQSVDRTDF